MPTATIRDPIPALIPADGAAFQYVPADITAVDGNSVNRRATLFRSPRPPPAGKSKKLLISLDFGGFNGSTILNTIDRGSHGIRWLLLNHGGFDILQTTCTRGIDAALGAGSGKGFCHAPGAPSGFYELATKAMCIKDTLWAIQWARMHADDAANMWDADDIGVQGNSSGAWAQYWAAYGPNRAKTWGVGGQHEFDTRPNWGYLSLGPWDWGFHKNSLFANWSPSAAAGAPYETVATSLADCPAGYKNSLSPSVYADPVQANRFRAFMFYSLFPASLNWGNPIVTNLGEVHDGWSGFRAKAERPGSTVLATATTIPAGLGQDMVTDDVDPTDGSYSPLLQFILEQVGYIDAPKAKDHGQRVMAVSAGDGAWQSGLVTTTPTLLVPAGSRIRGVEVFNRSKTVEMTVGPSQALCDIPLAVATGASAVASSRWLEGNGEVWGKAVSGSQSWMARIL